MASSPTSSEPFSAAKRYWAPPHENLTNARPFLVTSTRTSTDSSERRSAARSMALSMDVPNFSSSISLKSIQKVNANSQVRMSRTYAMARSAATKNWFPNT